MLARIAKDSLSGAPQSSLTAGAGIEILYFKSPAFSLSKITVASSKNLLASNTHALPLRLEVFRAQLASQELVAIMEKFGELSRIPRIACTKRQIAGSTRKQQFT